MKTITKSSKICPEDITRAKNKGKAAAIKLKLSITPSILSSNKKIQPRNMVLIII